MSRGNKIITSNHEYELTRECPDWLEAFAKEYEGKVTAVEVARQRNAPSLFDQIQSVMYGVRSPYSTVDDAIRDYQERTGFSEYRKQALAAEIVAAAEEEEKKNSRPALLDRNPAIDQYINNVVDTNYGVQIPALMHDILNMFARDGVNEADLDDPELARYINNLLINKRNSIQNGDDSRLGRYVGVLNEDAGITDNPFSGLMPARRW